LAEVVHWHHGPARLCEILGIASWAEIPPTRAHRYISLLACEGLITEVITTNYDCGVEKAYRDARGRAAHEWRAHAMRHHMRQPPWKNGEKQLRLYKINGCARRLESAKREEKTQSAEEILLTDRQLQQFGARRWASIVFEGVLRSHQLALSGFGSEEPQIWHV